MTQYVALLYYDRNQYWDSPPETEFAPEYTEFALRATEAGVMRGGEALHPVAMSTTITVSGGKGGPLQDRHGPHPIRDSLRCGASRPAGRSAGSGVPDRNRGPRPDRRGCGGPCWSRGRGDPAGPLSARACPPLTRDTP